MSQQQGQGPNICSLYQSCPRGVHIKVTRAEAEDGVCMRWHTGHRPTLGWSGPQCSQETGTPWACEHPAGGPGGRHGAPVGKEGRTGHPVCLFFLPQFSPCRELEKEPHTQRAQGGGHVCVKDRDRQTDRHRERHEDRKTETVTARGRQRQRHKDRQSETQ